MRRLPASAGLRRKVKMQTVIIVIHLMIVLVMIGAVLLQKSEGGGLGMGGGAGFMSSRGTANLLTRTTAVLAAGFFVTSLLMSWLASLDRKPTSIIGAQPPAQSQPAGGATPVAPPTSGGVLDTLKKADEQQQQNQAPAAPQAPRSQ
jgi:preprotein translocase subunit SecG